MLKELLLFSFRCELFSHISMLSDLYYLYSGVFSIDTD